MSFEADVTDMFLAFILGLGLAFILGVVIGLAPVVLTEQLT